MSKRSTASERGLTRAACDNCGNDTFLVHFNERVLVLECDACGWELIERLTP